MNTSKGILVTVGRIFRSHFRRSLTSSTVEVAEKPGEEKAILVDRVGAVTTIGINRPHKKNSLDTATADQLTKALDDFENDDSAIACVLHGIGGNFCAGFDLHEIANYDDQTGASLPHFGSLANRTGLFTSKPLIASVCGYAVGVGFELALMCDLRVVDETALMGFFNRRYGIPILSGGTVRLPAMIGYSRANDLILTGRAITADEAFAWGLANRLVSCGSVLGQAVSVAQSLVKFPQKTLLADRTSAHTATFSSKELEEALQFEKDNASHLLFEEGIKGAKRFVEKGVGRHGKFYHLTSRDRNIRDLDESLL